jgi:hypothetical protein
MKTLKIFALLLLIFLACKLHNSGSNSANYCAEPEIQSCEQEPNCTQTTIHNSRQELVYSHYSETSIPTAWIDSSRSNSAFYWNGIMDNGENAPCGKYEYQITAISNDSQNVICGTFYMHDSTTVHARTAIECSKLRSGCNGEYFEYTGYIIVEGKIVPDSAIWCMCCQ